MNESGTLLRDAHAVLLPLFDPMHDDEQVRSFLRSGGCSVALGMSREEYVAHEMSAARRLTETGEWLEAMTRGWRDVRGGPVLVAADYEVGGINRLQDLVELVRFDMDPAEFDEVSQRAMARSHAVGVTMTLGPILDVLTGENPWLAGRAVTGDPRAIIRASQRLVAAATRNRVVAVVKHFPGYPELVGDPALVETEVTAPPEAIEAALIPFRAVLPAALAVMVGPAPVNALDPGVPVCESPVIMTLLDQVGFTGLIVSDDLAVPGTARGREPAEVAVSALAGGCQLLLTAGDDSVHSVAREIAVAVVDGRLDRQKVTTAADRVRAAAAWTTAS